MISTVVIIPQKQDREKTASLLTAQSDFKVLAQGKDGYDALKLIGSLKPDIAVLDTHLEYIEGEEIPPLLRIRSPSTAVVILITRISDDQLYRAVSNEVSGFVCKETDMGMFPGILKCISEGGCFISPALAARVLHLVTGGFFTRTAQKKGAAAETPLRHKGVGRFPPGEDPAGYLSKMELRILACIGEGYTSVEIAKNLDLVVGTVRNYVSTIMRKTGVTSRSQMVRYAFRYGLVPPASK